MKLFRKITICCHGVITILAVLLLAVTFSCETDPCETDPESCMDPSDTIPTAEFVEVEVDTTILKNFPIIDVHQHIYSESSFWTPGFKNVLFKYYGSNIEHYEALVQCMHENNVVLAISGGPFTAVDYYFSNYPENNSLFFYSAEYGVIDSEEKMSALSDLKNRIVKQEIKSIGELTGVYANIPFHDSTYLELYAIADSFSLPVFVHTGIVPDNIIRNYSNYGYEYSNLPNLKPFLKMYPDVNFNAAHFGISNDAGYNFENAVIAMMKDYDNFYVDIGATIWWDSPGEQISRAFMERAIEEDVIHKVLYGSDEMIWPDGITSSINFIKQADYLTDTIRKQIFYWNAACYLKLTEKEIAGHFASVRQSMQN